MTERFTRARFEKALPVVDGKPFWRALGLIKGEYAYVIQVRPTVLIHIRSSVKNDGQAAEAGQDSIRCWLARDEAGKPLGSKDQRWITRTPGWDKRLLDMLRKLYKRGNKLVACPKCQSQTLALKSKKPGANLGRWYVACVECGNFLHWLDDDVNGKGQAA